MQVPLTWGSALLLIEYFHPSPLPSLDDTKAPQITAEVKGVALYSYLLYSEIFLWPKMFVDFAVFIQTVNHQSFSTLATVVSDNRRH